MNQSIKQSINESISQNFTCNEVNAATDRAVKYQTNRDTSQKCSSFKNGLKWESFVSGFLVFMHLGKGRCSLFYRGELSRMYAPQDPASPLRTQIVCPLRSKICPRRPQICSLNLQLCSLRPQICFIHPYLAAQYKSEAITQKKLCI